MKGNIFTIFRIRTPFGDFIPFAIYFKKIKISLAAYEKNELAVSRLILEMRQKAAVTSARKMLEIRPGWRETSVGHVSKGGQPGLGSASVQ